MKDVYKRQLLVVTRLKAMATHNSGSGAESGEQSSQEYFTLPHKQYIGADKVLFSH